MFVGNFVNVFRLVNWLLHGILLLPMIMTVSFLRPQSVIQIGVGVTISNGIVMHFGFDECILGHRFDFIVCFAYQLTQRSDFANVVQLSRAERSSLITVFKVEAITVLPIVKLNAIDASECWSKCSTGNQPFRYASYEQINIFPMSMRI